MALRRYGNQRDDNEQEIIDALVAAHCTVTELDTPFDLLVGRLVKGVPMTFCLEVKSAKGKLTPDQVEWHSTWRGHKAIVRTVNEALKAVGILR